MAIKTLQRSKLWLRPLVKHWLKPTCRFPPSWLTGCKKEEETRTRLFNCEETILP